MNRKKNFRLMAIVLCVVLVAGTAAPAALANPTQIQIRERVADPETQAPEFMHFSDIPLVTDGRVWTDKSVRTGSGTDDFEVTLSALSQTFPLMAGYAIPSDIVFVIDVSGSMGTTTDVGAGGRSRIEFLIDALNEVFQMLLNANAQNRVAVVAYGGRVGGYARVENLIPLGRPLTPRIYGGAFFSHSYTGGVHFVNVHTTNALTSSVRVEGSTPTQWGIFEGARILEAAAATSEGRLATVPVRDTTGAVTNYVTVTRRPNIILMTDGEPTMGRHDFAFSSLAPITPGPTGNQLNATTGTFYGDGSYGEMGLAVMTVLTAAYRKRAIENAYFPAAIPEGTTPQPPPSVGFYTISIGTQPTLAAQNLINATLNPIQANTDEVLPNIRWDMDISSQFDEGPTEITPTMTEVLTDITGVPGTQILRAQYRQAHGTYIWQDVTINNSPTPLTAPDINYATGFFEATNLEALRDAFRQITQSIQNTSLSDDIMNLAANDDPSFAGYLIFSDVLGEYMEFRGVTGLHFNGNTALLSQNIGQRIVNDAALLDSLINIVFEHMGGTDGGVVTRTQVANLVNSNLNQLAQNNSIRYYANAQREFISSFFDMTGAQAPVPEGATVMVERFVLSDAAVTVGNAATPENLIFTTLHVITALNDNTQLEEVYADGTLLRTLNTGDQMVRWYIPAALLPLRVLDPADPPATGNTLPIRVTYTVGLNRARVEAGKNWHTFYENMVPSTTDQAWFYANRQHRDLDNISDVTFSFFQPHPNNPFYDRGGDVTALIKSANPTDTAPHVMRQYHTATVAGVEHAWLGNNGRLTLWFENPPTPPQPPGPPGPLYPPDIYPPLIIPQTGVERNLIVPVIIIVLGVGVLVGAGFCLRAIKKKAKAKTKE
ncbi:MAG: VWA domain-containing protein [Oscillospiraceae bacterium]|nr:VWA domain-containing protein [Oscillospiraceae bacterium]MCL2279241.1 VWA domain-containing protein [Oscillospiraceae bacterium]